MFTRKSPKVPQGSPPRVREGQNEVLIALTSARITPACAGRTVGRMKYRIVAQDHPRVCGKDLLAVAGMGYYQGSPPRVREGPYALSISLDCSRITPACAGRTRTLYKFLIRFPDHPRVCGKDILLFLKLLIYLGSPPRVREGH